VSDRYEIRKLKGQKPFRWALHRIGEDDEYPEFNFDKLVGLFQLKRTAEWALAQIKANPNMNFAEWFFTRSSIYANETLEVDVMQKHCYKLWRALSGHHTVDRVREIMDGALMMLTYVAAQYENRIDDLEMTMAMQQAGEAW